MNTSDLKAYAPKARKDFIAAVTRKTELLGLNPAHPATVEQQGDVLLINGQAFPARIAQQRRQLASRIAQQGFAAVTEALAYTWFNRLVAIRYMELHGYLDHGYRVLSHPDGGTQPEILEHLVHLELPGLDRQQALEWKAAGNRDEDLYRVVLLAQCHALHTAMPFLFEAIDDATELLLPDGLLRTDSLIRTLVTAIEEASWQDVEIIGWLYQFYISEKKDQVIGKVVKSEDIPAATQLFTPNWIVKYMVQNSLGAQWLATYPDSGLKAQMDYYIEPAEQTDEVKAQLASITPASLDPEALTLIDPACGSGHILVEAYELFKAIYLERGYVLRDVPKLILEKNLFGLDIDDRAAQLTGFALMMKARADDRRLFDRGITLNVMALQDSGGFDAEWLAQGVKLSDYGLIREDLTALKALFEHATTHGSLIQLPEALASKLQALRRLSEIETPDLFEREALARLAELVRQAERLAARYDLVVANPPYMGGKGLNLQLREFLGATYTDFKSDLFAAFAFRCSVFGTPLAHVGIMSPNVWMYISSYEKMRSFLLSKRTLKSLVELPLSGFKGATVQICSFIFRNSPCVNAQPVFVRLVDFRGGDSEMASRTRKAIENPRCGWLFTIAQSEFKKIPGAPIAYWASHKLRDAFKSHRSLAEVATPKQGLATTDNDRFLRRWWECAANKINFASLSADDVRTSGARWFPCQKGGSFRKWFGNGEFVVNWLENGREIKNLVKERYGSASKRVVNEHLYFRQGTTWSSLSSSFLAMRFVPAGFIFETKGSMCFFKTEQDLFKVLGFCNSSIVNPLLQCVSPTIDFHEGPVGKLPIAKNVDARVESITSEAVSAARFDWNAYERSWDFCSLPLLTVSTAPNSTLEAIYTAWIIQNRATIDAMKQLEEENNRLFIDAYGLQEELTPSVPVEQITLTVNPAYRYGGKLSEEEQWTRFREDSMQELVSYAIGCMMGRYSLDTPGLIYANSGNEGFDPSRYTRFPADEDGIVPITDVEWFDDDACTRLVEFFSVAWGASQLETNLQFLATNLSSKKGEASRDAIRRYLCDRFFKDHLQTYKKRPIYWLFSSGKEQAFQCLVYLHRYNAGTLSRMRMEYVVPLQSRMQARIDKLADDLASASSSAQSKQLQKQKDSIQKKLEELRRFDEKLRHYADQRITLDLDDGVKMNYGKFGDLLAEVKAVTGGDSED